MKPKVQQQAAAIQAKLQDFDRNEIRLPGIEDPHRRACLVQQIIESQRRVRFVEVVGERRVSLNRTLPASESFDPIMAAHYFAQSLNLDEACWLIFLATHFGKHGSDRWQLLRDIYGALGSDFKWTWNRVTKDENDFRNWLAKNQGRLRNPAVNRRFGNHRKYESLSATSPNGTGAVVESYVAWVQNYAGHAGLLAETARVSGGCPATMFSYLYESMMSVRRFGRTARFDYLCFIGNLGIAEIEADKAYLAGSTGPLRGSRLLFGNSISSAISPRELERNLARLRVVTGLGMQVLEDSLCNWQKSPTTFVAFRG